MLFRNYFYTPPSVLNHLIDDAQSQARSRLLRGEERIEDPVADFRGDSDARIVDVDTRFFVLPTLPILDMDSNGKIAALRHSLHCVGQKIPHDLAKMLGIHGVRGYCIKLGANAMGGIDPVSSFEQGKDLMNDTAKGHFLDMLRLARSLREPQEVGHQIVDALNLPGDNTHRREWCESWGASI